MLRALEENVRVIEVAAAQRQVQVDDRLAELRRAHVRLDEQMRTLEASASAQRSQVDDRLAELRRLAATVEAKAQERARMPEPREPESPTAEAVATSIAAAERAARESFEHRLRGQVDTLRSYVEHLEHDLRAAIAASAPTTRTPSTAPSAAPSSTDSSAVAALSRELQALAATVDEVARNVERPESFVVLSSHVSMSSQLAEANRVSLLAQKAELDEVRRVLEARRVRIESIEERLGGARADERAVELRRASERLDLRVSALEAAPLTQALAARVEALEEREQALDEREQRLAARLEQLEASVRDAEEAVRARGRTTTSVGAVAPVESELRSLRGLGPKAEVALVAIGIRTLEDVAALEEDDVDRIARAVGMKRERFVSLGWIATARERLEARRELAEGVA